MTTNKKTATKTSNSKKNQPLKVKSGVKAGISMCSISTTPF